MNIRQSLAIIILLFFYGCYFFKNIMQRRQNIQTNHIGKGKTGIIKIIETILGMIFFNWPLFIITTFALIIFHLQIVKVEEPFLISVFGEDYINYKNYTNRYFGRKINFKRT